MLAMLRKISKEYMTPDQIRKHQQTPFDASEEIEMAYENIQSEARWASRGVKFLKEPESKLKATKPQEQIQLARPGLNTDSMLDHGAY